MNWRFFLTIENDDSHLGLKQLLRLSSDLGLKEAGEYALELKKVEKANEQKENRAMSGHSRPGSRRSSSRNSRTSSAISGLDETGSLPKSASRM